MKLLIVSQYIHPEVGGGPTRITNLVEGLSQRGLDVDVLTCLPNYPRGRIYEGYRGKFMVKEFLGKARLYRYWTYASVSKSASRRALSMISFAIIIWAFAFKRRQIKNYDCVIIQSPTLPVATSAMIMMKKLYKKKVILNISDLWPSSAVDLGAMREGGISYKALSWCERFLYKYADGIMGQSNEILEHINNYPSSSEKFLYRHLQPYHINNQPKKRGVVLKIVYAGVLNTGQDMHSLIQHVDFKELGVEFHIYGGGTQQKAIEEYIQGHPDCNIFYYGFVSKDEVHRALYDYDASLIPLAVSIKGAVPSKIYDTLPVGLPILYCGSGEAANLIRLYDVGFVSDPGDYERLRDNIKKLSSLPEMEYTKLSEQCIKTSENHLNFDKQMTDCINFVSSIVFNRSH